MEQKENFHGHFNWKVIRSGNVTEIYYYDKSQYKYSKKMLEKRNKYNINKKPELKKKLLNMSDREFERLCNIFPNLKNYRKQRYKLLKKNKKDDKKIVKKKNWRRRKRELRRKINTNKKYFQVFLTLTFAQYKVQVLKKAEINGKEKEPGQHYYRKKPERQKNIIIQKINDIDINNITETNYEFEKFKKKLKYRCKKNEQELKYICVVERQKSGAIHYHILLNIDFIPQKDLERLWGNGFIWIKEIKFDNLGQYLTKFLKDLTKEEHELGKNKKRYFCSRNLDSPQEIIGPEAQEIAQKFFAEREESYSTKFENDFLTGEYFCYQD